MTPNEPFQNVKALIVGPNSPAAPSEVYQAVAEFQAILTEEQRQEFTRIKNEKPVDCILTFTAELDLESRKRRRGHSIASRLRHVLQTVQEFSTVVDVFVSSNPDTAALIWGSVKFTILIAMNAVSFYEALSEFFLGLKDMLPRFSEYFTLYPQSLRLQKSLCDLHASLIRCCKHVVEASRRKWPSVFARSVFQSFEQEFRKDKADIESHCNIVNEDIKLARAQANNQEQKLQIYARENASQHYKSFKEFADRTDSSLKNLNTQQRQSRERTVLQQKQTVLDNLSSHDYQAPFIEGRRSRCPNTSEWLAKTPEFIDWKDGHESGLFWLTGKIGAGKTILTTAIIDHLLIDKKTPNDPVTFFFCRFDDKASLSVETLLRCLLRQMLSVSNLDDDFQSPIASIDDCIDKESFLLNDLLMTRVGQFKEVFIVVDGVDECEPADRQRIIGALHSLIKSGPCIKVFLASRERLESDLKKLFKPDSSGAGTCTHFSIDHPSARSDIATYIEQVISLKSDQEELQVRDRSLIAEIKKTLQQQADGMFLWVVLQIEELCCQRSDEDIRLALLDLPEGLPETFSRAVDRIIKRKNDNTVQKLMPWLLAARSPLTLDQLEEVANVSIHQSRSIPERYLNGIDQIASWFENLVKIDEETRSVHFIHSTVQQFFLDPRYKEHQSGFHGSFTYLNQYLGDICLTYLDFIDFKTALGLSVIPKIEPTRLVESAIASYSSRPVSQSLTTLVSRSEALRRFVPKLLSQSLSQVEPVSYMRHRNGPLHQDSIQDLQQTSDAAEENNQLRHPFLSYAAVNWLYHTTNFNGKSNTFNLLRRIVLSPGSTPWVVRPWDDNIGETKDVSEIYPLILDLQHVGLLEVALITRRPSGPFPFEDILMMAIGRNIPRLVDWFFLYLPRLTQEEYVAALKRVLGGTEEFRMDAVDAIFRLQRERRSQPWLEDFLLTAVREKASLVVEELLRRGANPDHRETTFYQPTKLHAFTARPTPVRVSMLHIACANNDHPTVLLLTSKGISLDGRDSEGSTPLCRAVEYNWNRTKTVETAIKHIRLNGKLGIEHLKSDPTIQIVTRLIDLKSNLEVGHPLFRAIEAKNDDIAWLLIQAGANVNARVTMTRKTPQTCLKCAKNGGQEFIVDELRKFGAKR